MVFQRPHKTVVKDEFSGVVAGGRLLARHFALAGLDEVGRGPLAGPVTAACVVLDPNYTVEGIADSKKLSPKKREKLYREITEHSLAVAVVSVGPRRIEKLNIREASRLAMKLAAERVVCQLAGRFSELEIQFLVDGNVPIETNYPQETIIKGDEKISVISAASIIAKVTRDRLMQVLDERYPGYDFSKHKGYPTKAHKESICLAGPCKVHRRSFSGVSEHISKKA